MKYKIAICDDEPDQLKYIASLVSKWEQSLGCACDICTFPSAEAFLFEYSKEKTYDILLLDVEMKGMSGIELARQIREDNHRAEIIFITSHFEFCGEGYEVDALHYLVKPVTAEKLSSVLSKAAERLSKEPRSVVITCDGETVRLLEPDIIYIEAFLHYIVIHTGDKEYKCRESISAFSARLGNSFYRTHRSFVASLTHIVKISRHCICLDNGAELPLARGKYDDINQAFIENN